MAKIYFFGKVYPESLELSIPCEPIQWNELGTRWIFAMKFENTKFTVECMVEPYSGSDSDFSEAYRRAFDVVKGTVGILSFAKGLGTTVIMDEHTDIEGVRSPIANDAQQLASHCTVAAPGIEKTYMEVLKIVFAEHELLLALNDLVESIATPNVSAVNCARVVEGLRYLIAPEKPLKEQWAEMHVALRLSQSYLQLITETSTDLRHGKRNPVTADVAWEIINRSWVVMNRFLEFRKRGNVALSESEFPRLI